MRLQTPIAKLKPNLGPPNHLIGINVFWPIPNRDIFIVPITVIGMLDGDWDTNLLKNRHQTVAVIAQHSTHLTIGCTEAPDNGFSKWKVYRRGQVNHSVMLCLVFFAKTRNRLAGHDSYTWVRLRNLVSTRCRIGRSCPQPNAKRQAC
jgi:hypothetical protein